MIVILLPLWRARLGTVNLLNTYNSIIQFQMRFDFFLCAEEKIMNVRYILQNILETNWPPSGTRKLFCLKKKRLRHLKNGSIKESATYLANEDWLRAVEMVTVAWFWRTLIMKKSKRQSFVPFKLIQLVSRLIWGRGYSGNTFSGSRLAPHFVIWSESEPTSSFYFFVHQNCCTSFCLPSHKFFFSILLY